MSNNLILTKKGIRKMKIVEYKAQLLIKEQMIVITSKEIRISNKFKIKT